MMHEPAYAWAALLLLGAVHGVNPAMGWLFAVSLGLQEGRAGAVWRAMGPLALGHAGAIVAAVAAFLVVGHWVPLTMLEWIVAALLVMAGLTHLLWHRHPRLRGMRVSGRELTLWSFLMASAHSAGLMALPFFPAAAVPVGIATEMAGHAGHYTAPVTAGLGSDWATAILGSAVHTAGYILAATVIAWVVYRWLGLRLLRTAWINLNLIWAGALIATGVLTLVL